MITDKKPNDVQNIQCTRSYEFMGFVCMEVNSYCIPLKMNVI